MVTRPSRNVRQLPVAPGILQKLASAFLLESQSTVLDNASVKVDLAKRQSEDGGEHRQRFCSSQFADTASAQQRCRPWNRPGRKISGHAVALPLVVPCSIEFGSPESFLFDIIKYFRKSNVLESKKLFTLK